MTILFLRVVLWTKKLYNGQNYVLHPFLENNTLVSISNPFNSKSLTAKIKKTINKYNIYKMSKMGNSKTKEGEKKMSIRVFF